MSLRSSQPGFSGAPSFFVEDALRTDGRARAGLATSIGPGGYRDEIAVVGELAAPLAVLHGADEQLVNGAYFASPRHADALARGGAGHCRRGPRAAMGAA